MTPLRFPAVQPTLAAIRAGWYNRPCHDCVIMTGGILNIEGKKFRVVPEQDYQVMKNALRQQQQATEDRTDLLQVVRRLNDPQGKRIPWSQVKKRARLA